MKTRVLASAFLILFMSFNNKNIAHTIDLGAASTYSVFTAVGAFNNLGESYMSGSAGTNVGAFTGFPPGVINGTTHVADEVSAQVALDLQLAYSHLAGFTGGIPLESILGNNETLFPGVYKIGSASSLTGDLILNGQAADSSVFVFQIDGAFAAAVNSRVVLTNSISPSNVYWQINGAVSLADSSYFVGTILAKGAISLMEASTLKGRVLSLEGAVSLHNVTVDSGLLPGGPLPIQLIEFMANKKEATVQLDWTTASETNNSYFMVQRSKDGVSYEELEAVRGAGNSNTVNVYSVVDSYPYCCTSYYQLKQVDYDGNISLSKIASVSFDKPAYFTVYPNPFQTTTSLKLNDASKINKVEFRIYNNHGKELSRALVSKVTTTIETSKLPEGIYFYKVIENNKIVESGKLISTK